ncbi:EF-hand domain-containing protein [Streptomyces sp. NPDC060048]|uniref:EF-hand domain-containing protein n=1 Tax=unclassified Streptomyces TaxID=2593676 RepID=UPI0036790409
MDGFWTNVIAPIDQDGDGKVDLMDMTEGFRRVLTDPALYPEQIEPVTNCFFDLVDLNGDGKIDQAEFQQMFDSVAGVPGEDCAAVFAALDQDGSGALDRAEFHQAVSEFFYGTDPDAPANHLFGRVAGCSRCGPVRRTPTPLPVWACGVKTSGQAAGALRRRRRCTWWSGARWR